jgi:hypothetical protein
VVYLRKSKASRGSLNTSILNPARSKAIFSIVVMSRLVIYKQDFLLFLMVR